MEFSSHYGLWGLALLMVVVASWVLYHYVAPRSWREWSRAGLVQAFIIALYAEMYGFPLTIYVLTGTLGINIPLTSFSGHLWATLLGYGPVGAVVEMLFGWTFIALGLLLLIRGWREVYHASREGRLATGGRALWCGPAPAVPRNLSRTAGSADPLADDHYARALSGNRLGIRPARAQGGDSFGRAVR